MRRHPEVEVVDAVHDVAYAVEHLAARAAAADELSCMPGQTHMSCGWLEQPLTKP